MENFHSRNNLGGHSILDLTDSLELSYAGYYNETFKGKGILGDCIQKFPDWLPGARTANGTAICH
jgi:hypothetical protein